MFEYVIWGIAPNKTDEEILLSKWQGKLIASKPIAEQAKQLMETVYKCREVRIQEINLSDNNIL